MRDPIFGEIIVEYSREEAILDGTLIDVSTLAREAGFVYPVALSEALWQDIETIPDAYPHEDVTGRLWDVLWMAYCAIRRDTSGRNPLIFTLILHTNTIGEMYAIRMFCGPGDNAEPVITMMRPEES